MTLERLSAVDQRRQYEVRCAEERGEPYSQGDENHLKSRNCSNWRSTERRGVSNDVDAYGVSAFGPDASQFSAATTTPDIFEPHAQQSIARFISISGSETRVAVFTKHPPLAHRAVDPPPPAPREV